MTPTMDPAPQDWANIELPGSWVDELDLHSVSGLWRFLRPVRDTVRPVVLPPELPGRAMLPAYLLQEFHRMPNGNYSKDVSDGYKRWFDASMLGEMGKARRRIVAHLAGARAALDLGCGAGDLAGALLAGGIPDVWALDPCPYLLKEGAIRYPGVRFVQGIAERSPFPDGRFDAVGVSFLFHELPSAVGDQALTELNRVMQPGARLIIVEPSPIQLLEKSLFRLLRAGGPRALYFKLLARFAFEPFVRGWHRKDPGQWLSGHGFRLIKDEVGVPMRVITAQKA